MLFKKSPSERLEDVQKYGELILSIDANFLTKSQVQGWVFEVERLSGHGQNILTWFYQPIYEKKYIFIKGMGDLKKISNTAKELLPKLNDLIRSNLNEKNINFLPFTASDIDYYQENRTLNHLTRF